MARPWRHPTTNFFYFRRAIPERFREQAGRREFKRSLNTADARVAKQRYASVAAEYDAFIENLEAPPPASIEAAPVETVSLSPGDTHILAGELWRWVLERYSAEPAPPEAFSKTAGNGPWGRTDEPWSGQRYQLVSARNLKRPPWEVGIVAGFVGPFLKYKELHLAPADYRAFCVAALDALDGALSDLQRRHRGDLSESPVLARYPLPRPEAPKARPKVKITSLIEAWAKSREHIRQRTRDEWERRLRQFSEFLGHDDALAVIGKDLRRWRDHLKAKGYKAKTINESCIAPVRAIFAAAEAEDVLKSNPFAGLKIALREDKTKGKVRRPYTDTEAAKVLKAARKRKDALRWLSWLMAYTGARINELAQLRKADVRKRDGIDFLSIAPETDSGQEIKTASSRREVPLHPAIIKEGFLRWVAKQRDGWLFSDLPSGRYGKRGDAASKRYGRWLRADLGITDKRVVAHSWRHRMADLLRGAGTGDRIADSILGHASEGESGTYGEGYPLKEKAKWIGKVAPVKV